MKLLTNSYPLRLVGFNHNSELITSLYSPPVSISILSITSFYSLILLTNISPFWLDMSIIGILTSLYIESDDGIIRDISTNGSVWYTTTA